MLRRFLFTFSIVASIIIIFSVIVTQKRGERRAFEVKQMELAEKVDSLSKTNEKLRKENKALVDDPIQIEREARDNYGYTREGEVTYKKYKFNISEPESNKAEKPTGSGGLESFLFDGPFPWQVPLGLVLIATLFLLLSYKYER
ncbi:MAG: septum formation initiator family protein [Candidatus Scalindua sp.]|jgi:cell division protein FtsB|nr:septum formation initiator family protein [Candidatus Scalindua sp.]MDP7530286.1 septum formation initiator family protein [Candidatus Scalindua sp.]|tara:strand:+ start:535 stop:966 length:432 start_codon:yes stop_codon:yes gene_type:complete